MTHRRWAGMSSALGQPGQRKGTQHEANRPRGSSREANHAWCASRVGKWCATMPSIWHPSAEIDTCQHVVWRIAVASRQNRRGSLRIDAESTADPGVDRVTESQWRAGGPHCRPEFSDHPHPLLSKHARDSRGLARRRVSNRARCAYAAAPWPAGVRLIDTAMLVALFCVHSIGDAHASCESRKLARMDGEPALHRPVRRAFCEPRRSRPAADRHRLRCKSAAHHRSLARDPRRPRTGCRPPFVTDRSHAVQACRNQHHPTHLIHSVTFNGTARTMPSRRHNCVSERLAECIWLMLRRGGREEVPPLSCRYSAKRQP